MGFGWKTQAAELYIDPNGKVIIRDAEIASLNNNVITIRLLETRWVLFVGSGAMVTNASGEAITVWQLQKGHMVYVEGGIKEVGGGKVEIDVKLLRDLSIAGSGKAVVIPEIRSSAPPQVQQQVCISPPPPPVSAQPSLSEPSPATIDQALSSNKVTVKRLQKGTRGEEVKKLQEVLHARGYLKEDEMTGFFGAATEGAVKKIQKANGISPEGFVGPLTAALIDSLSIKDKNVKPSQQEALTPKQEIGGRGITQDLSLGDKGPEVVTLQEFLQRGAWGIPDDGPVTGYYGKVTAKAVTKFQQANGLEAIGVVGLRTRGLINKLLAK